MRQPSTSFFALLGATATAGGTLVFVFAGWGLTTAVCGLALLVASVFYLFEDRHAARVAAAYEDEEAVSAEAGAGASIALAPTPRSRPSGLAERLGAL